MSWVTLRQAVATAVANASVYQTYSFPPNAPIANSCIVSWDDPAVEITNNQTALSPRANLRLTFTVPALDNQSGLQKLEDIIQSAITRLKTNRPDDTIRTVSAPQLFTLPSGDLMSADVTIQAMTSWS
jgi:hypothetical protein